ncbi:MAG: hypothetical protein VB018_05925, partial [Lachnospiraceae bacterium]|nr:hypothetical protein [Lachnospiraceae bacterium]
ILIQYFPFIPLHSSTSFFECSIDYFTAAIKLQNLTAIFLHFITVIDSEELTLRILFINREITNRLTKYIEKTIPQRRWFLAILYPIMP